MTTLDFPLAGCPASRVALGCMHFGGNRNLGETDNGEILRKGRTALETALQLGINFFDHADIYGGGESESVFGKLIEEMRVQRDSILIQTKCGIRFAGEPHNDDPHRYDFSEEHILRSVENSLRRLRTDRIDILLLHRPDALMEPEEIAAAFTKLRSSGKVRAFGVSNHTPAQMDLLRDALPFPLVANQVEINLLKTSLIDAGIVSAGREPAPGHPADGSLEYHRRHRIITQAWAPLAYGYLSGRKPGTDDPRIKPAAALVQELADAHGVPPEAIVIAWLLRHPAKIHPIIGTRDPDRIRACARATDVRLNREQWYRLYIAGRGAPLP